MICTLFAVMYLAFYDSPKAKIGLKPFDLSVMYIVQVMCMWILKFVSIAIQMVLQLLFSACVAAVKSRPVLHRCVVIFFWSSGIMECTCMLFTFENGVLLMR